jgi:DNA replication protein DnaC
MTIDIDQIIGQGGPDFLEERPDNKTCQQCGETVEPTQHPVRDAWLPACEICQPCRRKRKRRERELNYRLKAFDEAYESSGVTRRKRELIDPEPAETDDLESQFKRKRQVAPDVESLELHDELRALLELPPGNPERRRDCGAYIQGPTGAGKTTQGQLFIRAYLVRWLLEAEETHCVSAQYTSTRGFLQELKASYGSDTSTHEVFKSYADADLLVLDELGQARGSEDGAEKISKLIEDRNEQLLLTIFISNFGLNDLPNESRVYAGRTRWRIGEQCGASVGRKHKITMSRHNFRDPRDNPSGGDR